MARQENSARRREEYEEVRRNPYLVEYEEQRNHRRNHTRNMQTTESMGGSRQRQHRADGGERIVPMVSRRPAPPEYSARGERGWREEEVPVTSSRTARPSSNRASRPTVPRINETSRPAAYRGENREVRPIVPRGGNEMSRPAARQGGNRTVRPTASRVGNETARAAASRGEDRTARPAAYRGGNRVSRPAAPWEMMPVGRPAGNVRTAPGRRPATAARAAARSRRRRKALVQRAAILLWALCIMVLIGAITLRDQKASAEEGRQGELPIPSVGLGQDTGEQTPSLSTQGIPAEVFAKHPDWEENFLTPNEYSRPGDPLESVTSIFVHYTANPGTSAAQNRSYFEQQKDTHENSVSAHFIIGYDGEIIQCVPLDEIAYAVQSRNFDSVSIECCYKAKDGSFTQETYDSLISLLAWLVDAYDLETDDILRHYDCGGKKCPIYYTEHEDAWDRLKKDVEDAGSL